MSLEELLQKLWIPYANLNPQAGRIHSLLESRGEKVINDHIALRTFALPGYTVDDVAKPFVAQGYVESGRYVFADKHLTAKHWQHPDLRWPKVFISQIEIKKLTPGAQSILLGCLNQANPHRDLPLCLAGRLWNLRQAEYEALARESEYASWLAAWGFIANHFTVAAHTLKSFASLRELNVYLTAQGFTLNRAGGWIKGSPAEGLEQSSTMAPNRKVAFKDSAIDVPSCYYEFAWRYPLPGGGRDGELFQGFLEKSADKIFESTHRTV
jgi:Domain of unknown function (DUF1338)